MTASVAAIGAGVAGAVSLKALASNAASFQKQMSDVAARLHASGGEFEKLNKLAQSLGEQTQFSNGQVAEAMTELAKAGMSVEQVMASVGSVLNLAAADGLELGQAAAVTASALKKFELDASQAARVTDVLAAGAGSALTDVATLGEQLTFAAGPAREAGKSIEETVAALAALSDKVDKSVAELPQFLWALG